MRRNQDLVFSYGMLTDKGERPGNEDFIGNYGDHFFVLCDGLGGHGKGEVASRLVTEQMIACRQEGKLSMEESILHAQEALSLKQKEEKEQDGMKTTLACLEISGNHAKFAHVGDSRIYLFEKNKYKLRSLDHSIPQMLVQSGSIREKDIRHHEDRNRLLRVMGLEGTDPKYQVTEGIELTNKSTFLLCSDGFWEWIEEKQMSATLKKANTPQEWLTSMQKIIVANGTGKNMDNYSAIAVFVR